MADLSNWTEQLPSDDSRVYKGPGFLRDAWKLIAQGMAESLEWPGSGGGSTASQGELKPGKAKAWVVATSAASTGPVETHRGRVLVDSSLTRVYVYQGNSGSAATQLVGSPYFVEKVAYVPGVQWVEQTTGLNAQGSFTTDTGGTSISGNHVIGEDYDSPPLVFITSSSTLHTFEVTSTATNLWTSTVSGPAGNIEYFWRSIGTVTVT